MLAGVSYLHPSEAGAIARSAHPLLPLRVVLDRNRARAYAGIGIVGVGMFLFLTYYLQGTLRMSPVTTGLAFMPISGGVGIGSALLLRESVRAPLSPEVSLSARPGCSRSPSSM